MEARGERERMTAMPMPRPTKDPPPPRLAFAHMPRFFSRFHRRVHIREIAQTEEEGKLCEGKRESPIFAMGRNPVYREKSPRPPFRPRLPLQSMAVAPISIEIGISPLPLSPTPTPFLPPPFSLSSPKKQTETRREKGKLSCVCGWRGAYAEGGRRGNFLRARLRRRDGCQKEGRGRGEENETAAVKVKSPSPSFFSLRQYFHLGERRERWEMGRR